MGNEEHSIIHGMTCTVFTCLLMIHPIKLDSSDSHNQIVDDSH